MAMRIALMVERWFLFRFGRRKEDIMALAIIVPVLVVAALGGLWVVSLAIAKLICRVLDYFMIDRWK
jgi:hypothetical protein